MSYSVKEVFYTIQGEGAHAGTPAVFIRFSGCNLWSGRAEHRRRDAQRNEAECPLWCDTDFADGTAATVEQVVAQAVAAVPDPAALPLVVFSGGEPLLQLDVQMVRAMRQAFPAALLAVETNGTVLPKSAPHTPDGVDWVCVSPKLPPERLKLRTGDELKVVVPAYDPREYNDFADGFTYRMVTAEARTTAVGKSLIVQDNLATAAQFCMDNPHWRLTVQTHKVIGLA